MGAFVRGILEVTRESHSSNDCTMPTDTWWNLDDTKRAQIEGVALHEFAMHHYDEASLSAIVKQLGIAKGSMYQYFADKQELYAYLLHTAYDTLQRVIAAQMPIQLYAHADMFAVLRTYLEALRAFTHQHPALIHLINRSTVETHPATQIAHTLATRYQRTFAETLVQTARYDRSLRDDIDVDVAIFLITALLTSVMRTPAIMDTPTYIEQLVRMLDQGMRYRLR